MNKKIIARGLTLFAFVGLAAGTSGAADNKVFSGLVCDPVAGTSGVMVRNNGTIYNSSTTSTLTVACPVVRDNPGVAIAANSVSFDVFDRNAAVTFSCQLCNEVGTTTGLSNNCGSTAATGAGFAATAVQNIVQATAPSNMGSTEYSYAVCNIPASSGGNVSHLARIWMNET